MCMPFSSTQSGHASITSKHISEDLLVEDHTPLSEHSGVCLAESEKDSLSLEGVHSSEDSLATSNVQDPSSVLSVLSARSPQPIFPLQHDRRKRMASALTLSDDGRRGREEEEGRMPHDDELDDLVNTGGYSSPHSTPPVYGTRI
jgi:hypothetical protein